MNSNEHVNDKKVKQPYYWSGESFSVLDRRSNQPQHCLKWKLNSEQGPLSHFCTCVLSWGTSGREEYAQSLLSPLLALCSSSTTLADHTLAYPSGNLGRPPPQGAEGEHGSSSPFLHNPLVYYPAHSQRGFIVIDGCFGFLSHFLFHLHVS